MSITSIANANDTATAIPPTFRWYLIRNLQRFGAIFPGLGLSLSLLLASFAVFVLLFIIEVLAQVPVEFTSLGYVFLQAGQMKMR